MTNAADRRLRFLFAMFQGGGNIPLIMPIVSELVRRGHDVRVLPGTGIRYPMPVSARFGELIESSGATRLPVAEPDTHPYDAAPPLRGVLFGWMPERFVRIARFEAQTTLWSPHWANVVSAALRHAPVDVLVADYWLLGAIAAGEALHVPCAVIVHNACPPNASGQPPKGSGLLPARTPVQHVRQAVWQWARDRVWALNGLPHHNKARVALGLAPLRSVFEQYDRAERVLVLGHEAFDFPAPRLAPNVRYTGTPVDDVDVSPRTWTSSWEEDDPRPLVLVSLSTLPQGQGPAVHRIVAALDGMPVRALVTLGPSLNAEDFRPPSNVVLAGFVPHSAVLPRAAALVSQCGLGTLTKALRHGVPLLCVPLVGDQPDNAARIVAHGAGLRVGPDASASEIRVALNRILREPTFRERARRLGEAMSGLRAEAAAADELEEVASQSREKR
jgi:UDP:flavonoid glycosyltransferase YjiC (YdhE family)